MREKRLPNKKFYRTGVLHCDHMFQQRDSGFVKTSILLAGLTTIEIVGAVALQSWLIGVAFTLALAAWGARVLAFWRTKHPKE